MNKNKEHPILANSSPEVLKPIPWNGGELRVRWHEGDDVHVLSYQKCGSDIEIASHNNGHSCLALAERIVAGNEERVIEQLDYIERCGGSIHLSEKVICIWMKTHELFHKE